MNLKETDGPGIALEQSYAHVDPEQDDSPSPGRSSRSSRWLLQVCGLAPRLSAVEQQPVHARAADVHEPRAQVWAAVHAQWN